MDKLSDKAMKAALDVAYGLYRMNAGGADRYGFRCDDKQVTYGEFLWPSEGEDRVDWVVELENGGKVRPSSKFGCCCFNCRHWRGERRRERAYCQRFDLSDTDAPEGTSVCGAWEKRENARMPATLR